MLPWVSVIGVDFVCHILLFGPTESLVDHRVPRQLLANAMPKLPPPMTATQTEAGERVDDAFMDIIDGRFLDRLPNALRLGRLGHRSRLFLPFMIVTDAALPSPERQSDGSPTKNHWLPVELIVDMRCNNDIRNSAVANWIANRNRACAAILIYHNCLSHRYLVAGFVLVFLRNSVLVLMLTLWYGRVWRPVEFEVSRVACSSGCPWDR
jgi:hypothetical protein